jgi:HAD superfamily hydrolase (TIGR01450 family)
MPLWMAKPMYDAYIFDLDGTIYLGDALLPGAADVITRIRSQGRRTLFLSNNPTRTRPEYAAKLTRLGIPTVETDVVNSSLVLVEWLREHHPAARLFVVGESPLITELGEAGFVLTEDAGAIDWVVASFDRTFDYRKLQIAFDAIRAGARLIATNADRYCPVPGGGQPDAAAVIAAIEACTGATCEVMVGKPSPIMVATIQVQLGIPPERCLVVGDRLETDIAMGAAAGMDTALVLTGATNRGDLERSELRPTHVLANVGELLL